MLQVGARLEGAIPQGEGPDIIRRELTAGVQRLVSFGQARVMERTPVGVTSQLRGSVREEVRSTPSGDVDGAIYSNLLYVAPVEYGLPLPNGRLPFPPPEALERWVRRKLQVPLPQVPQVSFVIARKISREGFEGAGMFAHGLDAIRQMAPRALGEMADQIVLEMGGDGR